MQNKSYLILLDLADFDRMKLVRWLQMLAAYHPVPKIMYSKSGFRIIVRILDVVTLPRRECPAYD